MTERSKEPTKRKTGGEPPEWGPYRTLNDGELVNPNDIVIGEDEVPRIPSRIYGNNGHKSPITP